MVDLEGAASLYRSFLCLFLSHSLCSGFHSGCVCKCIYLVGVMFLYEILISSIAVSFFIFFFNPSSSYFWKMMTFDEYLKKNCNPPITKISLVEQIVLFMEKILNYVMN